MGARSGNNYLSALRRRKAVLWFDDVRVEDPTVHPVLRPLARTIASLYDLQMEHPAAMTYRLEDGDRIGYSYVQAQTAEDLQRRSLMLRRWAELSAGVIEETPDTMNLALAAMASAADFFGAGDARLAKNLSNYYREARHRDWCIAGAMLSSASDLEIVNQHDG
jgi:4-hydroxyphenylacetate 3-monooxygenase